MNSIRILEIDSNRKGDLFGRLMADLFIALGYEQPRLNIHKSGRELDLTANHRLEARKAIAECKSTNETTGGAELNKFVGALDAEHTDYQNVTGYFISLNGFKETAIEQEQSRKRTKIILLTGQKVIEELITGRLLITKERATEAAGRCRQPVDKLTLEDNAELLAHDRGIIWVIYYAKGKNRTHFALIHSDGTILAATLAQEIIHSDQICGGNLNSLACLNPTSHTETEQPQLSLALAAYRQYISTECGYIQLDGMPTDTKIGSRSLQLENLFVPLHLDIPDEKKHREPVGKTLEQHPRLAILAAPGGGKSTLIKRLAVAFSDDHRRASTHDHLPNKDWFPLFFRCRELQTHARDSFSELVSILAERDSIRQYSSPFRNYVYDSLASGRVLLLIDGLDEISDPGDRAAFVSTIRSTLLAYPETAVVITSREAGFRHVAAHLAPICTQTALSPLNADDIRNLSIAWHTEVLGNNERIIAEATQLADEIADNDRILRLAATPLLLTTLLLVKRWVRSLPTKRAVLYGKAVEVLLMTWNTEGHRPIPEEEALPQLCYVAISMILGNDERISRPRLARILQESRKSLPNELGFVRDTVEEFIHRVEDRSSLLMMTGSDIEDGQLVEFFEFRHLTFQEFLAARGLIEGWYPNRKERDTPSRILANHFDDEGWREIIPLAAVLAKRESSEIVLQLSKKVSSLRGENHHILSDSPPLILLASILVDEPAITPEAAEIAITQIVTSPLSISSHDFPIKLARGRFQNMVESISLSKFQALGEMFVYSCDYYAACRMVSLGYPWTVQTFPECQETLLSWLKIENENESIAASLIMVDILKRNIVIPIGYDSASFAEFVSSFYKRLFPILASASPSALVAHFWCIGHMGGARLLGEEVTVTHMNFFLEIIERYRAITPGGQACYAFSRLPLLARDSFTVVRRSDIKQLITDLIESQDDPYDVVMQAASILTWYRNDHSDDAHLREMIESAFSRDLDYIATELIRSLD